MQIAAWITWLVLSSASVASASAPGGGLGATPRREAARGDVGFIENKGQWEIAARYVAQVPGMRVFVERDALCLQVFEDGVHDDRGVLVRLPFAADCPFDELEALEPTPTRFSYFYGDDPARWVRGARSFGSVVYRHPLESRELELCVRDGRVEFALRGCATAGLEIALGEAQGAAVSFDDLGRLSIDVSGSPRVALFPISAVDSRTGDSLSTLDLSLLTWSTYLGGAVLAGGNGDILRGTASGVNDDVYVCGRSTSRDFPFTHGSYQHPSGKGADAVVARFRESDGTLLYCSLVGGNKSLGGSSEGNYAYAVAADELGRATVAGVTIMRDFPLTAGAYDTQINGPLDSFVFRLSADGMDLEYSTLIGGSWLDVAYGVGVAADGGAVVGGVTGSTDFPTTPNVVGPVDPNSSSAGFLARFTPDGSALVYSTYVAASVAEEGRGVAIGPTDEVTLLGWTGSPDYPVTPGAWNPPVPPQPSQQVFVTRLNSDATAILWSTVFGATVNDEPQDLELDAFGGVLLAGYTFGDDFPTTPGSLQSLTGGSTAYIETFVVRLPPDGGPPIYSTYFGGFGGTELYGLSADASGCATICGLGGPGVQTTVGAFQYELPAHAFIARLDPYGQRVLYGTFMGGPGTEYLFDVTTTAVGRLMSVGFANSSDYPTTQNAFDQTFNGGQYDGIVTCLEPLLQGVESFGRSTPACLGALHAASHRLPISGSSDFSLVCANAPPFAKGWLLIGDATNAAQQIQGAQIWIDLQAPVARVPVVADAFGWIEVPYSLALAAPGDRFAAQFVLRTPLGCAAPAKICASQALDITVR